MRYIVTVDGQTYRIEIAGDRITIDDEVVSASMAGQADDPVRNLLLDGASHTFSARAEGQTQWQIELTGKRYNVEAADERTHSIRSMTTAAAARPKPHSVRAPMPGLVVRVEVTPGQEVMTGQGVVVIEAMKMENELRAAGAGIVARVLVAEGQTVEKGAVLIEFEGASA
jgi:pyruvate carboxylase subunit B